MILVQFRNANIIKKVYFTKQMKKIIDIFEKKSSFLSFYKIFFLLL